MAFLRGVYHYLLAWLGAALYDFPSRRIFVLGVTGTKGKSSTLELINAVLEFNGQRTAVLSSLRVKIADRDQPNRTDNTMPGRFFIQKFLQQAVQAGCRYALIEVTSEGVAQYRHRFINFDAALFLNIHPEHIERHGSFEKYLAAKIRFFRDAARHSSKRHKLFIINEQSAKRGDFERVASQNGRLVYFSGQIFEKRLAEGKKFPNYWLASDFNLENAAAAASFAETQEISWPVIRSALLVFKGVPGRLEFVQNQPFRVVIDYAHTPDSLIKVYENLHSAKRPGPSAANNRRLAISDKRFAVKLICVLGAAGGGRDKWKRPEFGRIAGRYCREIILTNEDPYDENPEQILREIEAGILPTANPAKLRNAAGNQHQTTINVFKILDRQAAINKAVSLAKKGDTVIITGKGSEHWMHLARGARIIWSERRAVQEAIGLLRK